MRYNYSKKLLILIVSIFTMTLSAQSLEVSGKVIEKETNIPLAGATIIIKDTSTGVSSDFDGNFNISVIDESKLIFSYVGFITKEISTKWLSNLEVVMEEDLMGLDAVTVVAYGTQKKASVIAAVTSINPEELRVPTSNLTSSIAGRVAGVISYQRS